jgi:hypothetical protein
MFGGLPGSFLDLAFLRSFLLLTSLLCSMSSMKSSASDSACRPKMRTWYARLQSSALVEAGL